jgi:sterol desaturase/sphingolipid hydroxylase (fatty acid hydroxylase superfamily)
MNPLFSLAAFAPLVAGMVWLAVANRMSALGWATGIGAGLLLWTLVEYVLHRFVHERVTRLAGGRPPHLGHHARPTDLSVMVTPLSFTLPAALVLWGLLRLVAGDWASAGIVMLGVLGGYFAYEIVHYSVHMTTAKGPLRYWRKHHFRHHFTDSKACYGVTTPLWDYVFRSLESSTARRASLARQPSNSLHTGN